MNIDIERAFIEHKDKILRYARGHNVPASDAEDILHSVFEKIILKQHTYDAGKASLSTWIYAITRNATIDYYRQKKIEMLDIDFIDPEDTPEMSLLRKETLDSLYAFIEKLNKREQTVLVLHYYYGKDLKVISSITGISHSNTRAIHSRILRKMRNSLSSSVTLQEYCV